MACAKLAPAGESITVYLSLTNKIYIPIAIPPQYNASSNYVITLTSSSPSVCSNSGGTTITFAAGDVNTKWLQLNCGVPGTATLTFSGISGGLCVADATSFVVGNSGQSQQDPQMPNLRLGSCGRRQMDGLKWAAATGDRTMASAPPPMRAARPEKRVG